MTWEYFNNNPTGRSVGDCAIRAVSVALNVGWETAYAMIAVNGFLMGDMPSSNSVWGAVLRQHGFQRRAIESDCPDCYTAEDFINQCPDGVFVLGFGNHVATAVVKNGSGVLYDSWDSRREIPQYFWFKADGGN